MRVIHVLRKPLSEGTVASNTLKHGVGGLNIDASRINTSDVEKAEMLKMSQGFAGRKWGRPEIVNYGYEESMPTKTVSVPAPGGRWPANLILQHLDGCRCEGTTKIRAITGTRAGRHESRGWGMRGTGQPTGHGDSDGKETVANWVCVEGCPVRALDEQSGDRPVSGAARTGRPATAKDKGFIGPGGSLHGNGSLHNDSGGASRFFKQIGGKTSDG
jgi:hypothetical protein